METRMRKLIVFILLFGIIIAAYCISQETQDIDRCINCHSEKLKPARKYIHPLIKEGKCRSCHESYDEATHREDRRPELDICQNCHSRDQLGRSHPVGGGIIDPNTNDTMTCVSTCHSPHGSDYKYQTPFKNNMDLCMSCHKEF